MDSDNVLEIIAPLIKPTKVWSRAEVLAKPSTIPKESGIYAWYFREIPPIVPRDGCVTFNNLTLLYIGIGKSLYSRIYSNHFTGKAARSTLRRGTGCLLANPLEITIRHDKDGKWNFGDGEMRLSAWMEQNAYVVWMPMPHSEAKLLEKRVIQGLSLPLNIEHNKHHLFCPVFRDMRKVANANARKLPRLL